MRLLANPPFIIHEFRADWGAGLGGLRRGIHSSARSDRRSMWPLDLGLRSLHGIERGQSADS